MVVATRAGNSLGQKGLAEDIDLVVREAHLFIECIGGREPVEHKAPLRRTDRGFVDPQLGVQPRLAEQVTGDLLAHELVKGQVLIESPDQIVAILIGVRDARIPL